MRDLDFGGDNHRRNRTQIKKTTFIVLILTFIILNFFIASFLNVRSIAKENEKKYFITAEFKKEISQDDKAETEADILKLNGVKKVRYISKEEAFEDLQRQLDVAIPKSENSLSDSLLVYYRNPSDVDGIQNTLENNKNVKETFIDGAYIKFKDQETKLFKVISYVLGALIIPTVIMIYFVYCTGVSIDFINCIDYIKDEEENFKRAKAVNLLPFLTSGVIGTLIFFNLYNLVRGQLFSITSRISILALKEIFFMESLIIIIIIILVLILPKYSTVIRGDVD